MKKISICVFIKDNNIGAFGLWESMAQLMPFADEFFVMDMGSTDGTWETLKDLASKNKKIRLEQSKFPINPVTNRIDAGSFAEIPNMMIPECKNDLVMYYQADEIFHEHLLGLLAQKLKGEFKGLQFWRYQLKHNFQQIKWFPHLVHRIGHKDSFHFGGDGMNTVSSEGSEICSTYDGGWFTRWGAEFKDRPNELPTHEMILDISSIGGFLENIVEKRKKHAPFWIENPEEINLDGQFVNMKQWHDDQTTNPEWTRTDTQFNIPKIARPLLGKMRYPSISDDLIRKIVNS